MSVNRLLMGFLNWAKPILMGQNELFFSQTKMVFWAKNVLN
jgi:hypothetical protein